MVSASSLLCVSNVPIAKREGTVRRVVVCVRKGQQEERSGSRRGMKRRKSEVNRMQVAVQKDGLWETSNVKQIRKSEKQDHECTSRLSSPNIGDLHN